MRTEAVLLTGGKSRRMGSDKASMVVHGRTLAERTLAELDRAGVAVTVLGQTPIEGRAFLQDADPSAGPACALSRFVPTADAVFVASCDMPFFRAEVVGALAEQLCRHDAVVPLVDGYRQPLCAVYASRVFAIWADAIARSESKAMCELTQDLDVRAVDPCALREKGIDPLWLRNVNTPEELDALLREAGNGQ